MTATLTRSRPTAGLASTSEVADTPAARVLADGVLVALADLVALDALAGVRAAVESLAPVWTPSERALLAELSAGVAR